MGKIFLKNSFQWGKNVLKISLSQLVRIGDLWFGINWFSENNPEYIGLAKLNPGKQIILPKYFGLLEFRVFF